MSTAAFARRLSAGAELQPSGGAHVRVWAPACRDVQLVIPAGSGTPERAVAMDPEPGGFFSVVDRTAVAGGRYWFRLDHDRLRPDPVSRYQPDGPHGPSQYVDPAAFRWTDRRWTGVPRDGQVIYEMHVGTFTPEGTWASAAAQFPELARLGITVIEMMPIADFPGRFGWGYDGVDLYAPTRLYGSPDDLRAFVDAAHEAGLAVILDVVYNHFGPDGNYLQDFSPEYFTDRYKNDWGRAINFEGPRQARQLFVENAGYWIDEFHFDGLRLDATQDIQDATPDDHVIASLVARAREAAGSRRLLIVAENEPQDTRLVRPRETGGYEIDALWNDDAHHAAFVALTGRREAYYRDYLGSAQELASAARFGYLYQGQWYSWQEKTRGTPALDLPPRTFVSYLENHDQVANSAFGRRLHQLSSAARYRAMTALLLLGPATPMLFQGQEFGSSKPFLYFADHGDALGRAIRDGRREFLAQFPSLADAEVQARLAPPGDEQTFRACVLDPGERTRHAEAYAMHRELLAIRRDTPALSRAARVRPEVAVLEPAAFVLRYLDAGHGDRLLVVNLQGDLDFTPVREPLLAPPFSATWRLAWSSERPAYGGQGTPAMDVDRGWTIPGNCALWFVPEPRAADSGQVSDGSETDRPDTGD